MRIVHYLNQFFGGLGGEDKAGAPLEAREGAVGPGLLQKIREAKPDLFIAGPCFQAGRYGMAAGALCSAVQQTLGIPVVTGMSAENPGVDLYREALYIMDSGTNASRMRDVLAKMASFAAKLLSKAKIGLPAEEGYLTRGLIRDQFVEQTAAQRLVDMV